MKTPNSTLELADAIEALVASYVNSVRDSAQQAVERALSPIAPTRRSSAAARLPTATSRSSTARRTATELEEVCAALCERVRAQPGASMVELAEQMGADRRSLQRPMEKLRAAGRVRSVGRRHLTRYYPAVVPTAGSGA
jgi:DNA-binding NtrC family response regulator